MGNGEGATTLQESAATLQDRIAERIYFSRIEGLTVTIPLAVIAFLLPSQLYGYAVGVAAAGRVKAAAGASYGGNAPVAAPRSQNTG